VNETDQVTFVTTGTEYGKPYGARGIGQLAPATRTDASTVGTSGPGGGMPYFGQMLTAAQIKAVVDYERGL
jgi:mono/diheme cytochrome c family protein